MTSDDNHTPPLLDEDTEDEEDHGVDVTNNVIIDANDDDDDLTASDPTPSVTVAVPPPIVDDDVDDPIGEGRVVAVAPISSSSQQQQQQPAAPGDDQARKLFQRLWTDEDEIGLLQGFLDYSTQRGSAQNNPHDTALFYDQIKSKLQLDFNKNQLVEKLRRLKKKYRNVLARINSGKDVSFKSPHDQATFGIAAKIWGTTATPTHTSTPSKDQVVQLQNQKFQQQLLQRRIDVDDDMPPNFNPASSNLNLNFTSNFNSSGGYNYNTTSSHHSDRVAVDERRSQHKSSKKRTRERIEDQIGVGGAMPASSSHVQIPIWPAEKKPKNKISPLFRDMYERCGGGRGFVDGIVSPVPLSFTSPMVNMLGMEVADDKWRKQQILELEVYSKRLELVQEQIKLTLEQLRQWGADR